MSKLDFSVFDDSTLVAARFSEIDLNDASCQRVDFGGANLFRTSFNNCNLQACTHAQRHS